MEFPINHLYPKKHRMVSLGNKHLPKKPCKKDLELGVTPLARRGSAVERGDSPEVFFGSMDIIHLLKVGFL